MQLLLDNGQKFLIFAVSVSVWAQPAQHVQCLGALYMIRDLHVLLFALQHHTSLLDAIEHTCNRHKGCQ